MTTNVTASAYEELVAAIVKAVPDVRWLQCDDCGCRLETGPCSCCGSDENGTEERPITLEDVLRALNKPPLVYACDTTGAFLMWFKKGHFGEFRYIGELTTNWVFGHDLAWHRDNAPETITFLHSLLV